MPSPLDPSQSNKVIPLSEVHANRKETSRMIITHMPQNLSQNLSMTTSALTSMSAPIRPEANFSVPSEW